MEFYKVLFFIFIDSSHSQVKTPATRRRKVKLLWKCISYITVVFVYKFMFCWISLDCFSFTTSTGQECPLSSCPELEGEEDSLALLNELLGGLSVDDGDFSREWTEVFGDSEDGTSAAAAGRPADARQEETDFFLPSHLLDQSLNNLHSSLSGQDTWTFVSTSIESHLRIFIYSTLFTSFSSFSPFVCRSFL